jgi:hypothetical protein
VIENAAMLSAEKERKIIITIPSKMIILPKSDWETFQKGINSGKK